MASPIPVGVTKEQAFSMAQTEMEYRVELFNNDIYKLEEYKFETADMSKILRLPELFILRRKSKIFL
ncbi:hypothetical protein AtNW77_Chr2g0249241 [Arabidopsis thaliana]